jgi:DNA-binding response OmpR family regulator
MMPRETLDTSPPAAAPRVLVIEDDIDLREPMVTFLNRDGIVADGVGGGAAFSAWAQTHDCDLFVVDLGLPDADGLDLVRDIVDRCGGSAGIIVLTARSAIEDKIEGYEAGIDCYLVKPVDLRELARQIRAVHRRLPGAAVTPSVPAEAPSWRLDPVGWTLTPPHGSVITLTAAETAFLRALAESPGKPVGRTVLIAAMGFDPRSYDLRRMEILVRRLRKKVMQQAGIALPLETVHALGFALVERFSGTI